MNWPYARPSVGLLRPMPKFLEHDPVLQARIADEVGPDDDEFPAAATDRAPAIRRGLKAPRSADQAL